MWYNYNGSYMILSRWIDLYGVFFRMNQPIKVQSPWINLHVHHQISCHYEVPKRSKRWFYPMCVPNPKLIGDSMLYSIPLHASFPPQMVLVIFVFSPPIKPDGGEWDSYGFIWIHHFPKIAKRLWGFNLQLKELAHALQWPEAVSLLQDEAQGSSNFIPK